VPQSRPNATRITLHIAAPLCLVIPLALPAQTVRVDATALVRRAVQHRLEAAKNHQPLQYIVHRIDERRDSTKVIIETADGDVARLIAINGKPLSADATQAELNRLDTLAQHPDLQERRRRNEDKDRDRITHLLSLLPDAFLYKSEGTVACGQSQCYNLSFTPNPHWTPPDLEAGIFRGLAGQLWIDQSQERLVRLDTRFIADADVGFGLIGRLNKGGTALLEQSDIGNNDWELTRLTVRVAGKAFVFKSFTYQVDERTSQFTPVSPGLHYRDAIDLLKQLNPSTLLAGSSH
jgi:hypothetical protein